MMQPLVAVACLVLLLAATIAYPAVGVVLLVWAAAAAVTVDVLLVRLVRDQRRAIRRLRSAL